MRDDIKLSKLRLLGKNDILWQGPGTYCYSLTMKVWVMLKEVKEVAAAKILGYDIREVAECDLDKR